MPARIRLTRHGKKGQPFYHIVVADGRAPRDGRFIEKIGTYNPLTKPADIVLDFNKALEWLNKGAQPSDTVRAILSYKGVMHKNHLLKGVKKGALTEEQAEAKFQGWLKEKEAKIAGKVSETENELRSEKKKRLEAEAKVREARAAEVAKKRAEAAGIIEEKTEEPPVVDEPAKEKTDTPAVEEIPTTEEKAADEPKAEEDPETKEEEPKVEELKEEIKETPDEPQKSVPKEDVKAEEIAKADEKKEEQAIEGEEKKEE